MHLSMIPAADTIRKHRSRPGRGPLLFLEEYVVFQIFPPAREEYLTFRHSVSKKRITLNDRKQNGIGFYLFDIAMNVHIFDANVNSSIGEM